MENAASLASDPDRRRRRVSYVYEPAIVNGNRREAQHIRTAYNLIFSYNLHDHMDIIRPSLASYSDLTNFHSPEYISFLGSVMPEYVNSARSKTLKRFNLGEWDSPVFNGLFDYCRLNAGGSICAAAKLNRRETDIAINWSGGMHGVKRDKACGFGYINDVVLAILELLKVFKRVLYIYIGFNHGGAVQEAFNKTDRVMTVSFHKSGEFPHQRRGGITDYGVGKGEYYSLNAPLKNGLGDASFTIIFTPVIHKAMEVYQPEAIVLQCCPDSLSGDALGKFNLSTLSHARSLRYVRSFNVPLLVLGGEGHTLGNVARSWCFQTAVAVGEKVKNDLPKDVSDACFAPDYKLYIRPYPMKNSNNNQDIAKIEKTLLMQLSQVLHAPSLQFQDTPSISQVTEAAEEDMETRQKPSYESDSDENMFFLG